MDIRNNDIVTRIVVGIVCFAVFIVVLKLTSGPAPSEKKAANNVEKKAPAGKRKETSEKKTPEAAPKAQKVAAPKEAAKPAATKAAAAPAPAPAKAAPVKAAAPAPVAAVEATKKSKETAEERESRKERQEVAKAAAPAPAKVSPKAAPAAEKVSPKAAPAASSKGAAKAAAAAAPAPKPVVVPEEEEWEVVGDRRKQQKPKKAAEESPRATEETVALPRLQVVTETKTVSVEAKKIGALIGPKGVTLRHIQEVTSTLIQIPKLSSPKEGESAPESAKVSVTGPAAGVAQAIKMLSDIASGTPTVAPAAVVTPTAAAAPAEAVSAQAAPVAPVPVVETVNSVVVVDTKKLGVVIGPKGATFKAIQEATSTILNTASGKDSTSEKTSINVSGLAEGVKKAVKAINELASKGYCTLLAGENFQESFITVDTKFLPEIIGKAGANIKAIQEHSSARVVVPSTPAPAPGAKEVTSTKITIAGSREGVALAKQIIKEITEVFHHSITHPGVVHNTVAVPERYYNVIIGTKGSEIRHIQNNFKVSVKIPNETSSFRDVMVLGQPAECEAAIRYIQKLVEKVQEKEQMREQEKFAGEEEESYDEELMNRYVYSRQNRNAEEPAAQSSTASPPRRTISSERPPGFSPLKGDSEVGRSELAAVPIVWGNAAPQSWGPVK